MPQALTSDFPARYGLSGPVQIKHWREEQCAVAYVVEAGSTHLLDEPALAAVRAFRSPGIQLDLRSLACALGLEADLRRDPDVLEDLNSLIQSLVQVGIVQRFPSPLDRERAGS